MRMIDKLDVRVPRLAPYTPKFAELYRELAWTDAQRVMEGKPKRLHSSRYYESVIDLREFGYDAILHSYARLGKNGDHKIELIDTGRLSYSHLHHEIESIFDIDPQKLAVMRVDLATDVPGIPVLWFVGHCRVQYKRWAAEIGQIVEEPQYSAMGMKVVQTFYLGKRPNVIRIYDKIAEYRHQYAQLLRKVSVDAEFPTFEQTFDCLPDAVLTRVERQLAGGRIPPQIDSFKKLRSADSFNPFQRLKFVEGSEQEPRPNNYRSDVYQRGMAVRRSILEQGLHRTRYLLNEQSPGNADRTLR